MRALLDHVGRVRFTRPLEVVLSSAKPDIGIHANIDDLDIHAYGQDLKALLDDLVDELESAIREYRDCGPSELHPSALALRAKLEELVE